jgi:hypothetical protein
MGRHSSNLTENRKNAMNAIVILANDFPWIFAPATLIALITIFSYAIMFYRFLRLEILMIISGILVLVSWMMIIRIITG